MKKHAWILALALIAGCANPPPDNRDSTPPANNTPRGPEDPPGVRVVVEANDVAEFRGTRMAQLLQSLDSNDPAKWAHVRRHVHPRPLPPREYDAQGRLVRENYKWPPQDPAKPGEAQRAWRSYRLWPEFIAGLLHGDDWNTPAVRARLANFGRMYELTWKFQTARLYSSATRESEHWRTYAETMLAYGADGESMLVSNMILALTNPSEDVVRNAQSVLVNVGEGAIEPLCAALWVGFRQAAVLDDGTFTVQPNANFNKYVVEALYRIGPRAASQAVFELENSLDDDGQAKGTAWRFRKHFIDLLGRFGLATTLRTLEAELDRVKVIEYDEAALRRGQRVVDQEATDTAAFVFREQLLLALSGFRTPEALRPVIRIWQMDSDHAAGAARAIQRITGDIVTTLDGARALARRYGVDKEG
ncbi:MAG: hypothetical protein KJ044_03130 [Planctomycetes bacterium]|nr:hypothetical protein [Planctomycetota bacterium]